MQGMVISENTLYEEIALIEKSFRPVDRARLILAAERHYFPDGGWWSMKIGDFVSLSEGDRTPLGVTDDPSTWTAFAYYAMQGFGSFVDEFVKVTKALEAPMSAREAAASSACQRMTLGEGMLVFVRSYFGCKSFAEAAELPLCDYVIARKDNYNKAMFERAITHKR